MDKLLFFNKEGYPYNFSYNSDTDSYDGKLYFDPNSNDTYKTLGLYIFEKVEPVKFESCLYLNQIELFNYSGVTIKGETYKDQTITDIKKVNSVSSFYSKWVFGTNFDTKFPKGTIVSFSGITFTTDFKKQYYTVIDNKPNAILIITETANNLYNSTFITGGTITSHNIITYPDYDNTVINKVEDFNLQSGKKFNLIGSSYNEGTYTYVNSAITTCNYNSYLLSANTAITSINIGDTLKLELTLLSERYKIYQGPVEINTSGTTATIKFTNGINSLFSFNEGQQIIFEDYNDNTILGNPVFTIIDGAGEIDIYYDTINFIKEENQVATIANNFNSSRLSSQNLTKTDLGLNIFPDKFKHYDYYLELTGETINLYIGDDIYLSSNIHTSGLTLNEKRNLKIVDIIPFETYRINYWTNRIESDPNWLYDVQKKALTNNITLSEQIYLDAKWMYDINDSGLTKTIRLKVDNYVIPETGNTYRLQKMLGTKVDTISCSVSIPSTQYYSGNVICYNMSNKVNFEQEILDTNIESTITALNYKYRAAIDSYGLEVYYMSGNTLNILSDYGFYNNKTYIIPKVYINNISGLTELTNGYLSGVSIELEEALFNEYYYSYETGKTSKNFHAEILFTLSNNSSDYGFNINLNQHDYFINYVDVSTGTSLDTQATINYFITTYYTIFSNIGIIIQSGYSYEYSGYTLIMDALYPNIEVYNLDVLVNIYSTYEILVSENQSRDFIQLIGNEIITYEPISCDIRGVVYLTHGVVQVYFYGESTSVIDSWLWELETPSIDLSVYAQNTNAFFHTGSTYNISLTVKRGILEYTLPYILDLTQPLNTFYISGETSDCQKISFFDIGLATGMILSLSGSSYPLNNKEYNIINLTDDKIELSYQGPFFKEQSYFFLETKTFLRKPRESYYKDIYYNFKFTEPFSTDIFFYDITGDHLEPYLGNTDYTYIGPKPLWDTEDVCSISNENITLTEYPNTKLEYVSDPTKQQTMWYGKDGNYCLKFKIDQYDSSTNYNFIPEPLQVFLGFNSKLEGISQTTMVMDKVEYITLSGYTNDDGEFYLSEDGLLTFTPKNINFNFSQYGFEKGQFITIDFVDQKYTGQTIFENYGEFKVLTASKNKIKLDNTAITFSTSGTTEGFYYEIKVQPRNILTLALYGQTEVEDERFLANLKLLGVNLDDPYVEHIFIESDIKEDGVDYILLNQKRKEMISMFKEIYNYVGSYKALINAINFFGYNELQLNEYYMDVDPMSPNYQKLQRVLIPDIFDNSVVGWNPYNFIKGLYKKGNWKKTNLFNLTYKITDEDGNSTLVYSLEEVQKKLTLLKKWLKKNVIPLSANIIDITGVVDVSDNNLIQHDVSTIIKKSTTDEDTTAINFHVAETLNFDQNYLFEINFYTNNSYNPSGWTCKIQTFTKEYNTNKLIPQQYIKFMKNDLETYSFNLDKVVDEYLYIETSYFNERGCGITYNKLINTSTSKNYILINNNFHVPNYGYLNIGTQYYHFNKDGFIYLDD